MNLKTTAALLALLSLSLAAPMATAAPKADTNGDGTISLAEYQAAARTRLLKLDTDGDGKLSLEEWLKRPALKNAKRDPTAVFNHIDTNHDGFIDAAEMDTVSRKRFERLDTNSDGQLSKEERHSHKKGAADGSQE